MPKSARREAKAHDWKVGAASDLPVDDKAGWDGPEAAERILDAAGFNGDKPDCTAARRGFLIYDAANPGLKGSYKEPFADILDGKLTAMKAGLNAAASRLPQTDAPHDVKAEARKVLDAYEAKDKPETDRAGTGSKARGLGAVSWLAWLLEELGYVQQGAQWEAEMEGDNSPVPGQLLDAVKALGKVLIDMTAEEVKELIGGDDTDVEIAPDDDDDTLGQRALRGLARIARSAKINRADMAAIFADIRVAAALSPARAGKVLSASNEKMLRQAHGLIKQGSEMLIGFVEGAVTDDEPENPGDPADPGDEQERAKARAKILKLRSNRVAA